MLAEKPFPDPFAMVRAAAVLLSDGDVDLAMEAVRRFAVRETQSLAEYASKPWQFPDGPMAQLLALRETFPMFDPVAAADQGATSLDQ